MSSSKNSGWCSTTKPYSYLYDFSNASLTSYHYELCETMVLTSKIFSSISLQLMLISIIILILTTFIGRNKEDYNWFIFNTAFLNLFYGLFYFFKILHDLNNNILLVYMQILMFIANLANGSIALLAFNRFLNLYFPIFYVKVFKQNRIVLWILFFEFFMICIYLNIYVVIPNHVWGCQTLVFLSLVITLICSFLIIGKLQKFMHISGEACERGSTNSCRTRDDVRRAAIVCIWQASTSFLHTANVIFALIFVSFLSKDPNLFETFYPIYIVICLLQHPLYQVFVISDAFVTMFLLRSYRSTVIMVYKGLVKWLSRNIKIHAIQATHGHGARIATPRRKSAF